MSTRKQTATIIRIIAVVLILASVAMFFLPWMKASVTVLGQSFDLSRIFDFAAQTQGKTGAEVKNELFEQLQDSLNDLQSELSIHFDTGKLLKLFNTVLKGAWSPMDLLRVTGGVKKVMPTIVSAANMTYGSFGGSDLTELNNANRAVNISYIVLLVLLILTLIMAVVAIVSALTDRKGGTIPYLAFVLILLVLTIVGVAAVNKRSSDLTSLAQIPAGMGSVGLKLGVGAILATVFAALAFVVLCLPIGKKAVPAAVGAAPVVRAPAARAAGSGWKCPNCGTMLRADQKFCLNCGTKRPEPPAAPRGWTCPGCGAKLKTEQKFCPNCGTKQPEKPAAPQGWTCPGCGTKLKTEQKFCPNCGTKQPEKPAAPQGWTCPGCGAKLKTEQKFCPNCGTRQPDPAPAPAAEPRRCALCGTVLKDGMLFCPNCGTRAEEPAPTVTSAPAYTPAHAAPLKEPEPVFEPEAPVIEPAAPAVEEPKPAEDGDL